MNTAPLFEPTIVPRCLVISPPLSDAEFERFCLENDNVQIERTKDGVIELTPPAGLFTGSANSEINYQLRTWWKTHHQGCAIGSNVGFFLPDGSMLSPDAAYVLSEQLEGLTKAQLTGFPYLCPAFVIELLSAADRLAETQKKMGLWIANGSLLGWLVDPYKRQGIVYVPGSEPHAVEHIAQGSGPVAGLALDLAKVWSCYEL